MSIKTTSIHERIKLLRIQKHMTMQDLADAVGAKHSTTIFFWEKTTVPRIESIRKLADALDTTVEFLINGEGVDEPK